MKIIIFLTMIYCHILDDFKLQGILSQMKRYTWWINQEGFNRKYNKDYCVALLVHGFSWAFTIQLPVLLCKAHQITYEWATIFTIVMLINAIIHVVIDDAKANRRMFNLIQDQLLHLVQICVTFLLVVFDVL